MIDFGKPFIDINFSVTAQHSKHNWDWEKFTGENDHLSVSAPVPALLAKGDKAII